MPTYECDQCGACCKFPIIEIEWVDVLREPRIRDVAKPLKVPDGMCLMDEKTDEPIENPDTYMAGAMLGKSLAEAHWRERLEAALEEVGDADAV